MYKKILIATDGSELSHKATDHGISLAQGLKAEVVAVFVIDTRALPTTHPIVPETMAPYHFSLIEELRKLGDTAVREVGRRCDEAKVTARLEVTEGTPAAGILEVAKREGADLIVMGTHGRSGFAAVLLGSTAQAVVHKAEIPVLVVRV